MNIPLCDHCINNADVPCFKCSVTIDDMWTGTIVWRRATSSLMKLHFSFVNTTQISVDVQSVICGQDKYLYVDESQVHFLVIFI